MKILIISKDTNIIEMTQKLDSNFNAELKILDQQNNIDLISSIYDERPAAILFDDDSLKPDTVDIIKSSKKFNKDVAIIFVTSDPSLELGKEVSQLGIHFYAMKPLDKKEFSELISSIEKIKEKSIY